MGVGPGAHAALTSLLRLNAIQKSADEEQPRYEANCFYYEGDQPRNVELIRPLFTI